MIEKKARHEGEIPRDYRMSSRDPFEHYFVFRRGKAAKKSRR